MTFRVYFNRRRQFVEVFFYDVHPNTFERWGGGQSLPRYTWSPFEHIRPDRIFEPEWYNQTYFTVAVETAVDKLQDITKETTGQRSEDYPCELFVTEKTFKPIIFKTHRRIIIFVKWTYCFSTTYLQTIKLCYLFNISASLYLFKYRHGLMPPVTSSKFE